MPPDTYYEFFPIWFNKIRGSVYKQKKPDLWSGFRVLCDILVI